MVPSGPSFVQSIFPHFSGISPKKNWDCLETRTQLHQSSLFPHLARERETERGHSNFENLHMALIKVEHLMNAQTKPLEHAHRIPRSRANEDGPVRKSLLPERVLPNPRFSCFLSKITHTHNWCGLFKPQEKKKPLKMSSSPSPSKTVPDVDRSISFPLPPLHLLRLVFIIIASIGA